MSTEATNHVWIASPQKGAALLVLLAIADSANPEGKYATLTIRSLMRKTRLSRRAVQDILNRLEATREIRRNLGFNNVSVFTITSMNRPIKQYLTLVSEKV